MKNPILLDIPSVIETPRLVIRLPRSGEGRLINAAIIETIEGLSEFMPWARPAPSVDDSEIYARTSVAKFQTREEIQLTLWDRATGEYIGGSGFHRINWKVPRFEMGYWVRKSREGQGLISESTNALTRFAFGALGARRLEIRCDSNNVRSSAVPRRLGFIQDACFKNEALASDGVSPRDTLVFSRCGIEGLPALKVKW